MPFWPERNLTAVGMSAEHQINPCARGAAQDYRIMREEEFHFVIAGSRHGQ